MFVLEDRDSEEFVLVIQGYVALLTDRELTVNTIKSSLDETRKFYYLHKYFSLLHNIHTYFLLHKQIQILLLYYIPEDAIHILQYIYIYNWLLTLNWLNTQLFCLGRTVIEIHITLKISILY